jgi:glycosyltransferase involved in cell wall biosynthesis
MNIHWFEFKLLDKSTNHATETEMIKQICKKGHHIEYYCGYEKEPKRFAGVSPELIHYFPAPKIRKIRGLFLIGGMMIKILYSILLIKPDAFILDYMLNLFCFPILLVGRAFNHKTRIVLDIRTLPVNINSFNRDMSLFLFSLSLAKKTCHAITFITPFMRYYCSKKINLRKIKTSCWSSGFDPDLFCPAKGQEGRSETLELFYHGGLSICRGIGSLIKAVKILKERQLPVVLTLVGIMVNEMKIMEIIKQNKLQEIVNILSPVTYEQVPSLIANCDLPVIPLPDFIGWRVSSPIKLIEYLGMGKPVVLTAIEAHRDVVGTSAFAFFARSDSPEDLAAAIERAYKQRERFGEWEKPARRLALASYTWEKQAQQFLNFVEGL